MKDRFTVTSSIIHITYYTCYKLYFWQKKVGFIEFVSMFFDFILIPDLFVYNKLTRIIEKAVL